MALIADFNEVQKTTVTIHKPVRCGYCSFIGKDQRRYLLLETYGSEDREIPDKVSQSLQLDEAGARELIAIIKQEFPNLA